MINAIRPNFAKDTLPQDAARIHNSWLRCASLDNKLLSDPNPVSRANLEYNRAANQNLVCNASASLKALDALVSSLNSVVILTDPNGLILYELGSNAFQAESHKIALQAGVVWSEQLKGTNAIGTALHDGKAVRIHGSEHFVANNNILSCHAAPIFSAEGKILGVLDISGPAKHSNNKILEIVKRMALNIANQILDNSQYDRLEFCLGERNPSFYNRAILLLDDNSCIAGANETALQLLNADWNLIGTNYEQWLDGQINLKENLFYRADGQKITGRIKTKSKSTYVNKPCTTDHSFPVKLDESSLLLLRQAVIALDQHLSVLLNGETGSGKEILARQVHNNSKWSKGPFIAINCAALPEQLIESELFGYMPGAFTGAKKDGHKGLLEQANNGVLFLDEIGDMPISLQTRLLRVIQERKVQPLGANKFINLNFGLISATNQNLPDLIEQGKFRADLYYRLQDMPLKLPALRHRPDIVEFIKQVFNQIGGNLSFDALSLLANHNWPGNYRELRSVLLRLVCLYPQQLIEVDMLPEDIKYTDIRIDYGTVAQIADTHPDPIQETSLRNLEQAAIQQAIQENNGNISQAAKHLGIHRSTLYRKLKG